MTLTRGIVLPRDIDNITYHHTRDLTRGNKFFCKKIY